MSFDAKNPARQVVYEALMAYGRSAERFAIIIAAHGYGALMLDPSGDDDRKAIAEAHVLLVHARAEWERLMEAIGSH